MKKIIPIAGLALILSTFVIAHSSYLFDIKLDFDKSLEANVIKSAQEFMKTEKKSLSFDLDRGLIIAHFENDTRNYVRINPIDFKVYGMQNENLRHKEGTIKYDKRQGLEIAKKLFDAFPKEITSELAFDEDISEFDGTYYYKWFRFKNGLLIVGDELFINVDAVNGNIIGYRIPIFYISKEDIKTNPAITMSVTKRVAEIMMNAPGVKDFKPYIVSYNGYLVWVNKLQGQLYPFYIGINAMDGSISFSGIIPGEVPKNYEKGTDVEVIETNIIKQIYNSK